MLVATGCQSGVRVCVGGQGGLTSEPLEKDLLTSFLSEFTKFNVISELSKLSFKT